DGQRADRPALGQPPRRRDDPVAGLGGGDARSAGHGLTDHRTNLPGRMEAAVIFDCDGTLVDSEPLAGRAWKTTVAPYGYAVTDDDLAACTGTPYARTHAYLQERVPGLPAAEHVWPAL